MNNIAPINHTPEELRDAIKEQYSQLESLDDLTAADLIEMAYTSIARKRDNFKNKLENCSL